MASSRDENTGEEMHRWVRRLFPLHRSLTGDGVRQTFSALQEIVPWEIHEVPSGTEVLDWQVPQEWEIADAYIADVETGRRLVDYADSNLHVLNYSQPIDAVLTGQALAGHLFSNPDQPDWIPYRTSYFREQWGFCVSEHQKQRLIAEPQRRFRVVIDSRFFPGSLSYAETVLPGRTQDSVLLYAHTCHPSLANDNLSGIIVATFLAKMLRTRSLRYEYRIVLAPATIGAITWLSRNQEVCSRIKAGLVLTLLGDPQPFTYKRSQQESALVDRVAEHLLGQPEWEGGTRRFTPTGYDERQFCSPGFDLPLGCLMRSPHAEFPEYHTSADNLDLVQPAPLAESLRMVLAMIDVLEGNRFPRSLYPYGEPQLGRYGIYRAYGEADDRGRLQEAAMWILNQATGGRDLLAIAERASLPFSVIARAAELLAQHQLITLHDEAVAGPPLCSARPPHRTGPSAGRAGDCVGRGD